MHIARLRVRGKSGITLHCNNKCGKSKYNFKHKYTYALLCKYNAVNSFPAIDRIFCHLKRMFWLFMVSFSHSRTRYSFILSIHIEENIIVL